MPMQAIVVRGTVCVPNPEARDAQRHLNLLGSGHAARTHAHTRFYRPGDSIAVDDIGAAELERLIALGVCRLVSS